MSHGVLSGFLRALPLLFLGACVPGGYFRAPLPMEGLGNEVGLGTEYHTTTDGFDGETGAGAQFWYLHSFDDTWSAGAMAFVETQGTSTWPGGGAVVRWMFYRKPLVRVGVEWEAGWAWTGMAVPTAFALNDDLWLTVTPSARIGVDSFPLRLPVGIAGRIGKTWVLQGEVGYGCFNCLTQPGQVTAGVSVAKRF